MEAIGQEATDTKELINIYQQVNYHVTLKENDPRHDLHYLFSSHQERQGAKSIDEVRYMNSFSWYSRERGQETRRHGRRF